MRSCEPITNQYYTASLSPITNHRASLRANHQSPVTVRPCELVSHGNTARFAKEHGDHTLGKICGLIAADEGRHEIAYQRIMDEVQYNPRGLGARGC